MKKLIALLLAFVMVLGMVACTASEPANESANKPAQEDTNVPADDSGEVETEPVTLRVATFRYDDEEIFAEIIKMFNDQYPWITIEWETNADQDAYYQNLLADAADGKMPDVFDLHDKQMSAYYAEGLLMPQDDMAYLSSYANGALVTTSIDGVNYGFANACNLICVLYNKDVFNDLGLNVPTTFAEFQSVCEALKAAGYGGLVYPGGGTSSWMRNSMLVTCAGSEAARAVQEGQDDNTIDDVTSVAGVDVALNTIQALVENDLLYDAYEATTMDQAISMFAQEMCAMFINGTWLFGTKADQFPDVNTGIFNLPTLADNGKYYGEAAQVSCISASTKHEEAAKLWVEFLATPEISSYYCSNAKMISTIEGVGLDFEGGEDLSAALEQGVNLLMAPALENKELWEDSWKDMFNSVLYGEATAEEAIKTHNENLLLS